MLVRTEFSIECAVVVCVDVSEVLVVGWVEQTQFAVTGTGQQNVFVGLHRAELHALHALAVIIRSHNRVHTEPLHFVVHHFLG